MRPDRSPRLLLAVVVTLLPGIAPAAADPPPPRRTVGEAAIGLASFRAAAGEPVRPWIVELEGEPAFRLRPAAAPAAPPQGPRARTEALVAHARTAFAAQDALVARAAKAGIRLLPRVRQVVGPDGGLRRVEYRFHYLLHGFVAYLPDSDVARLRAMPGVRSVEPPGEGRLFLDNSVDYVLGSDVLAADRRLAVYGAAEELDPLDAADPGFDPAHPEETDWAGVDGFEGQGTYLAVVDSGLDFTHPAFGGSGLQATTPAPQSGGLLGAPPSSSDNRKVVYFYNLGGALTLDDFGHGTHVAATAAGFRLNATTTPGTPGTPGAPPGGVTLHGVAPQAKLLGYPVCDASGGCAGDIELAIEDAASPVTLVGVGDGGTVLTGVPKPLADVVNLSLGGGNSPDAPTSRVANNAVLAGVAVIAAAGNDGPGAQTVGAPCVGTLVTCVAAAQDPGSIAGADVLAAGQIVGDACAGSAACAAPGPPEETGAASNANLPGPGPQGTKLFFMAGGGAIPGGSVSAHYVFVDRDQPTVPASVGNRVAVLKGGTGTFFQIVNPVAVNAPPPAAILLVTDTSAATAVAVVNGVPTFTVSTADGEALLDLLLDGDDDAGDPPHGAVSTLPLRVQQSVSVASFDGAMGDFSSRGPNAAPAARHRTIKPDVAAPGVGILAATTTTGNPNNALGMANPSGYTVASGTSMATPHAAGAALLARQYLRTLGFDSLEADDPADLAARAEAALLVRALLMNNATNLRSGLGAADADPAPESLNDVGAGLLDVAAALSADAVMWGPVTLHDEVPNEYTPAGDVGPGDLEVTIPSHSFGNVPLAGVEAVVVRTHPVTLRDISLAGAGSPGGGTYDLTFEDNRLPANGFDVSFTDLGGVPIGSVAVPAGGEATFLVRVEADGSLLTLDGQEVMWYVSAHHQGSGKRLRMPFYLRAVSPELPAVAAPDLAPPSGVEAPGTLPCPTDTDGSFGLAWTYTPPADTAPAPVGFRVERGTFSNVVFADDAAEPLVAGANSAWTGSPQWTSQLDPDTLSLAYFVPDLAEQDEALTLDPPVVVPEGGASLSFHSRQDTEEGFDFLWVEISRDGGPFQALGAFSGAFTGTRRFDISAFSGGAVQVRFRMQSDLAVPAPGVWIDDVTITADDFAPLATTGGGTASLPVTTADAGEHLFRVRGLFATPEGTVGGPVSEDRCVAVDLACVPELVVANQTFAADQVLAACETLSAGPAVVVAAPAAVTFVAGERVILGDGFRVESGARFVARVDPALFGP